MRLVCPNCDAKYEVPDDAIPEIGRDVQCANCNHAWFQMKPGLEPDSVRKTSTSEYVPTEVPAETPTEFPEPEPAVSIAAAPVAASPTGSTVKGYAVDDSVLAILREEAEREAQARRNEARAEERVIETQPDLGLDTAIPPAAPMRESEERIDLTAEEALRPSARRDLLPDVEEINSTLRPSARPVDPDAEIEALPDLNAGRNSFRSGFLMMIALAILGLVAYLAAPQLSEQVPSLQGPLTAYVGFVDTMRVQLDGLMQSATLAINGGG